MKKQEALMNLLAVCGAVGVAWLFGTVAVAVLRTRADVRDIKTQVDAIADQQVHQIEEGRR